MKKGFVIILMSLFALTSLSIGRQKGVKVLLLYDMEGVTGATSVAHILFGTHKEYQEARKSLTADVNAAIAGLKAGGATEIVVVDGHGSGNGTGPDLIVEELLAPAKMISRDRPFDVYMDSYDQSFDAVAAVAMHAGAGNAVGFLSHTYTIEDVRYKVNGVPFNETMILAMGAARFGIPLVMVSGDDELEREIGRFLPWVKCASVKHAVDRSKAEPLDREEANRRIEEAAREGLLALGKARLPEITAAPFRFALTFQDETQAQYVSRLQGAELLRDSISVQIAAADFEAGYLMSLRLISTAGLVGRLQAYQRVLSEQPNAAVLRQAVSDTLFERWIHPWPAQKTEGGGVQHYWGAR